MKKKINVIIGILIIAILLILLGISMLISKNKKIVFIEQTKALQDYQVNLNISIDEESSVEAIFNINQNVQDVKLTLTRQGMPLTSYYTLNYETEEIIQQNMVNNNSKFFDSSLNVTDILKIIKEETCDTVNHTCELETSMLSTKLIAINNLIQMFPSFFDFDDRTQIIATVLVTNQKISTIDFDINQMHFHYEILENKHNDK